MWIHSNKELFCKIPRAPLAVNGKLALNQILLEKAIAYIQRYPIQNVDVFLLYSEHNEPATSRKQKRTVMGFCFLNEFWDNYYHVGNCYWNSRYSRINFLGLLQQSHLAFIGWRLKPLKYIQIILGRARENHNWTGDLLVHESMLNHWVTPSQLTCFKYRTLRRSPNPYGNYI